MFGICWTVTFVRLKPTVHCFISFANYFQCLDFYKARIYGQKIVKFTENGHLKTERNFLKILLTGDFKKMQQKRDIGGQISKLLNYYIF